MAMSLDVGILMRVSSLTCKLELSLLIQFVQHQEYLSLTLNNPFGQCSHSCNIYNSLSGKQCTS